MVISLDQLASGLVISSLFLMAISIPRITIVLFGSKIRFFFLDRIVKSDEFINKVPAIKILIPDVVINKWREPEEYIRALTAELTKITDLHHNFIEGGTAALLLLIAALYLGTNQESGLVIILLVTFLIFSVIYGLYIDIKYAKKLTRLINDANASKKSRQQNQIVDSIFEGSDGPQSAN